MAARAAAAAGGVGLLTLLGLGCELAAPIAEPWLCDEARKSCNPTEPGYDDCIARARCGPP